MTMCNGSNATTSLLLLQSLLPSRHRRSAALAVPTIRMVPRFFRCATMPPRRPMRRCPLRHHHRWLACWTSAVSLRRLRMALFPLPPRSSCVLRSAVSTAMVAPCRSSPTRSEKQKLWRYEKNQIFWNFFFSLFKYRLTFSCFFPSCFTNVFLCIFFFPPVVSDFKISVLHSRCCVQRFRCFHNSFFDRENEYYLFMRHWISEKEFCWRPNRKKAFVRRLLLSCVFLKEKKDFYFYLLSHPPVFVSNFFKCRTDSGFLKPLFWHFSFIVFIFIFFFAVFLVCGFYE